MEKITTPQAAEAVVGLAGRTGRTREAKFVTGFSWDGDRPARITYSSDRRKASVIRLKTALRVSRYFRSCGWFPFVTDPAR